MRDNDLAKNLGKTNKEVTDTLQKNNMEENSSMTNGAGTQPAGENKEGAAPAKKRIAAVYRPRTAPRRAAAAEARDREPETRDPQDQACRCVLQPLLRPRSPRQLRRKR